LNLSDRAYLNTILFLGLLCYLIFFHGLGNYALWDPDEGRIGIIAKEILASGNWATLTHNGVPYYDKPVPTIALVKEKHIKEMNHIPPSKLFVWKTIPSANALVANFPPPRARQ